MSSTGQTGSPEGAAWPRYYEDTTGRPPRRTTLTAIAAAGPAEGPVDGPPGKRPAIDLGCGGGRDTAALLDASWRVLALDQDPGAKDSLKQSFPEAWRRGQLSFQKFDFAAMPVAGASSVGADFGTATAQLVNASFCLPLCPPPAFPALWNAIDRWLTPDGLFAGHFFGPNDTWARRGDDLTIHTRRTLDALFDGWTSLLDEEEETDSVTPRGKAKHWHIFHIVARKPG